ncbi:restriction endonuclease subunit S [Vibrio cholerae]
MKFKPLEDCLAIPLRNGLTKPKKVRGQGYKMVNMGELFSTPIIDELEMDRVPLTEKEKVSLLEAGDLLFARQSLVREGAGQCSIFWNDAEEVCFESHIIRCRINRQKADPLFLFYYFQSNLGKSNVDFYVEQGAGAAGIRGTDLLKVLVPDIDVEHQSKVAKTLYQLDRKIKNNFLVNQTLEQMAQAIFKSWFVEFDPVKAKMNGELPEGMDAATASLFPEKLVESELGLIPEGWSASSMGEHFNITMGQSPKGETYNEEGEGIAFFQGRRDFGFRYPDVRVYTTDPKRFAKAGDTLISVRAPVGDKNMAAIDCCIGRGVAAIKHKSDSRSFTYAFMSHIEKKLGDSGSSGTVFSSINQKELKKVSFVAPPQELIEAFHKIVDPIDQKVEVLSKEIESLSSLRDTLLPKLLSGEIELGETEEMAEVN